MFQMNAGYFLIQLASEKDKAKVYEEIGKTIRKDAYGCQAGGLYRRHQPPQSHNRNARTGL
jgi:hypothetical protein